MTKIRIISDIHYTSRINGPDYGDSFKESLFYKEYYEDLQKDTNCVNLIAGDIAAGIDKHEEFLEGFFPNQKVIFVDGNHCLTENCEVLTETGWKSIKELSVEDRVYQYNNGYCELVKPERIVQNKTDYVIEFSGNYFYQCVTDKHRMLLKNNSFKEAKELLKKKCLCTDFILTSNTRLNDDLDYPIDDNLLRLLVWVVTDATIVLYDKTLQKYTQEELEQYKLHQSKTRIQFHLSKERKINELCNLLKAMKYDYTFSKGKKEAIQKLQPVYIRMYSDNARKIVKLLDFKKEFPSWFLNLSKRQINIVLETLAITDGKYYTDPHTKIARKYHITWGHTNKNDTDILQAMCIKHGYVFKYKVINKPITFGKTNKTVYWCDIYTKFTESRRNNDVKITEKFGSFNTWCITVPSGAFLIRMNGITSITGNCVYEYTKDNKHPILSELKKELKQEFPITHLFWHYLENDWCWIDENTAVIGSTFYTDYNYCDLTLEEFNEKLKSWDVWTRLYGLPSKYEPVEKLTKRIIRNETMIEAGSRMNDFKWGKENNRFYLSPEYYLKLHKLAKKEVKRCHDEILKINPKAKIILMTHHCLSPQCISEKYKKGLLNASYTSDLEKWIDVTLPAVKLVISGHVHNRCDFTFGKRNVRYITNPCGYIPYEEDKNEPKFNINLFVETDSL